MKKIFKIIMSIVGICYLGIILFVTGCLLFYNQYKVTQINDKTFIIIDDKSDMYKDGDLVIFTKNPNDDIVNGDEIFFYEITNGTVNVVSGKVTNSEKITDIETTYTINGNHKISSESVIGKTVTASTYPNVGKVLYVFESRFGFLLLVILPALIFFFYEIYRLVQDIKVSKEEENSIVSNEQTVLNNNSSMTSVEPVITQENSVQSESIVTANASVQNEAPLTVEPTTVDNTASLEQINLTSKEQNVNTNDTSLTNQNEAISVNKGVNTEQTESLNIDDKKEL